MHPRLLTPSLSIHPHLFLASCFLDYADTRPLSAPPCPMCRATVTMIMARHFGELMPVTQHRVNRFNDRFAGGSRGVRTRSSCLRVSRPPPRSSCNCACATHSPRFQQLWTMALEAPVLLRHLFQNFRNEPIPGLVSVGTPGGGIRVSCTDCCQKDLLLHPPPLLIPAASGVSTPR